MSVAHERGRRVTVDDVMTEQPITIGRNETLATAHTMMRQHGVRHLPVLEHGELVGLLSQRDLYLLESIGGADLERDTVDDAMTTDTYAVAPTTPIEEVAETMARERYGCAVVMERDRVIGIFTATDALDLLARS